GMGCRNGGPIIDWVAARVNSRGEKPETWDERMEPIALPEDQRRAEAGRAGPPATITTSSIGRSGRRGARFREPREARILLQPGQIRVADDARRREGGLD